MKTSTLTLLLALHCSQFIRGQNNAFNSEENFWVTNRPALTAQMERLNKSPYFQARMNQFEGILHCSLIENSVGEPFERPTISLGAKRIHRPGERPEYALILCAVADNPRDWALVKMDKPLQLAIGEVIYQISHPGQIAKTYKPEINPSRLDECYFYAVNMKILRALAFATNTVQIRVFGAEKVFERDLGRINLNRFKIFLQTYCLPRELTNALTAAAGAKKRE